jgi:hypothetical protein
VTTTASLNSASGARGSISPTDVGTIIETLGRLLVDAYAGVTSEETEGTRSAWGSKQREELLYALIKRVAFHARKYENAALSATDAALAAFARSEFKDGRTRSDRDRAPITKNIDKVVGGWLRRLGKKLRQNAIETSMTDEVPLGTETATFRLTLTFAYPWRVVADRRLLISARVDEVLPDGKLRPLPVRAEPDAPAVALPDNRRRYQPAEAEAVRQYFLSLKAMADLVRDPELKAYADTGLRTFVPLSIAKVLFVVVLTCAVGGVMASPPGRRFVRRVVDAITSSGSLRELLEKLKVDPQDGVFVTPSGARSQTARSGSGSEIRMSPGQSPELLHIQASISGKDLSELVAQMSPLADMAHAGVTGFQFRSAPEAPILPWLVEVDVIPEQDKDLAAEFARQKATVSVAYDPPLPTPTASRLQSASLSATHIDLVSELREVPHRKATYAITATVRREARKTQVYYAELRVDASGFMTLHRQPGKQLVPVKQDVRVGQPICTTLLTHTIPMPLVGQTDYVWALANAFKEQDVILVVYPPSSAPGVGAMTVEWGDSSKATFEAENQVFSSSKHTYRVGERTYPIKIYFKGSDVVYDFDLYVFRTRSPVERAAMLDYVTPYPPNPEPTLLASSFPDTPNETAIARPAPVTTDSITFSRQFDLHFVKVTLPRARHDPEKHQVRYFWGAGSEIDLSAESPSTTSAPN